MLGTLSRRLRVGTFHTVAQHLLPPALRHQHPDADLAISETRSAQGIDLVASGVLDVAIVACWGRELTLPPGLQAHQLLCDPIVLCLPDDHPVIRGQSEPRGLRLDQLDDQP
ncbi:LysR substrate-binding domain-containing protein [Streptomyces milbemycinicus]|uniref:LysR substrate-binding domain-containing protein n=1 Tax=Streptomyces milbemycinicus TaxID=476552 RepID=A0ABW8M0V8_9ACTN